MIDTAVELGSVLGILEIAKSDSDDSWYIIVAVQTPSQTILLRFVHSIVNRITLFDWNVIPAREFTSAKMQFNGSDDSRQHIFQLIREIDKLLDVMEIDQNLPREISLVPYNDNPENYGLSGVAEIYGKDLPPITLFGHNPTVIQVIDILEQLNFSHITYFLSKDPWHAYWDAKVEDRGNTALIITAGSLFNLQGASHFFFDGYSDLELVIRITQAIANKYGSFFLYGKIEPLLITPKS